MRYSSCRAVRGISAIVFLALSHLSASGVSQQQKLPKVEGPWMNTNLSPDERADLVMKEMTLDEKIQLLHGNGMPQDDPITPVTAMSNRGGGYVIGIPRLGIPPIDMCDAAYGVRGSGENGRYSTALPSNVALAASWDTAAAFNYGALIGSELRAQGYNMSLAGGVDITRDPRNGRTFEYLGEDPVLAGTTESSRSTLSATSNTMRLTIRRADAPRPMFISASRRRGRATYSPLRLGSSKATPPRSCARIPA